MEKLSSRQNKTIAHLRRLGADRAYRRECAQYVCDGEKLLREAVKWGAEIKAAVWRAEPTIELPDTVRQYTAPQELLDYATALKNCPGVLFTVEQKPWAPAPPGRTLVLETIQDPGNLGAILRTANALGMDTVILTGQCADLYNPKTVRSAMGALFRQRVYELSLEQARAYLSGNNLRLYGAALSDASKDIRALDLKNAAVAIGSEGSGLSPELLEMCDGQLIIPMNPACESLNAAVAAAIVMWELTK
ncbi:MAG: RNA methyltransferase [Butyricicoccus sp.]|nr:RNA methyltransferase [Butyricicoccus sp.]